MDTITDAVKDVAQENSAQLMLCKNTEDYQILLL